MGHITKNSWVPSVTLHVGAEGVDVAALLLGADGRVRGDADMVFDGQPVHPSGSVRHESAALVLELNEVEAAVERIVIAGSAGAGVLSAVAPDGEAVASCTVTGAPDVTAVAFGEFFRESGGWKFGGIGQGYASGLAGLVTEFGVEVEGGEPEPAVAGPVPLAGVAKVPGQAPPADGSAPAVPEVVPVAASPFPPADRPYELVEGWEFGPVFEPVLFEGQGNGVIALDGRVQPGPVLVEIAHEDDGYVGLFLLDKRNKDGDYLFNTLVPDYRGSTVTPVPKDRPLRLRLDAENRWVLRVKPVAAARRLEGTLSGYGPEALLYLGDGADLHVNFKGSPNDRDGYVGIQSHGVRGRTGGGMYDSDLLLNKIGPLQQTVPVPQGPQLLLLNAEGAWTLTTTELGR
ncbi:TerD family protein [Streptomyces sp. NBC_01077]|uniref:TerD family protein n=1 Tax=Streptomyces sp. NBC_01077 TaxID=2903746 RepID=UPI003863F465|nr:TerD family protein [Streptomyces sp. NBC_01077]